MAIRTKRYKLKHSYSEVATIYRAIQITNENLTDIVAYICRNGGAATGHNGDTKSGRPARIRIKQECYGHYWSKKDWRVARVGDWIVRIDPFTDSEGKKWPARFERIKKDEFEARFSAA